ncbi:hypothetical protein, partial [Crossiella equi]
MSQPSAAEFPAAETRLSVVRERGAVALPAELRRALVELARTPRLLVACDYDGTLAPIVAD